MRGFWSVGMGFPGKWGKTYFRQRHQIHQQRAPAILIRRIDIGVLGRVARTARMVGAVHTITTLGRTASPAFPPAPSARIPVVICSRCRRPGRYQLSHKIPVPDERRREWREGRENRGAELAGAEFEVVEEVGEFFGWGEDAGGRGFVAGHVLLVGWAEGVELEWSEREGVGGVSEGRVVFVVGLVNE